jgi:ATP-dependent DNA helicase DinG
MIGVEEVLGPGGVLAGALPGYESRPGQLQMAAAVRDALAGGRSLLVEAGTGTGKTLAYLVPAILSGMKVVISTGTKNLQEQIFHKDIPLLRAELPTPFRATLMKGISNYLCLRRYSEHRAKSAALGGITRRLPLIDEAPQPKPSGFELERLLDWARTTESGDRAELAELADDDPLWREVSATVETRQGQKCPRFEDCFVTRARRRAQEADVVIVNHHLFFADLALRASWPQAQLLPSYEAVIFDEAHQLEDIVTDFFGTTVSTLRLLALDRDLGRAIGKGEVRATLGRAREHVERRAGEMFDELRRRLPGERVGQPSRRTLDRDVVGGEVGRFALELDTALEELAAALDGAQLDDGGDEADALARRAHAIRDDLSLVIEGPTRIDSQHVFWGERRGRTVLLHASPVDVAEIIRDKLVGTASATVFTSATLTTGASFEFVRQRLGLEGADEARVASPFDYRRQALLYLPRDLPEPNDSTFSDALAERMRTLVEIFGGRAFLLFTSHRQMQAVHARLRSTIDLPLYLQGERPKHLLVEEFRKRPSVLCATQSFWEGVDVPGDALSLVAIDKLPFSPPDDPLLLARSARLEGAGHDAFLGYHVPRAALALAQGFGRLIRTRGDRGVVAILDRRAATRSYGRRVLSALPADCPRTDDLEVVRRFRGEGHEGLVRLA